VKVYHEHRHVDLKAGPKGGMETGFRISSRERRPRARGKRGGKPKIEKQSPGEKWFAERLKKEFY